MSNLNVLLGNLAGIACWIYFMVNHPVKSSTECKTNECHIQKALLSIGFINWSCLVIRELVMYIYYRMTKPSHCIFEYNPIEPLNQRFEVLRQLPINRVEDDVQDPDQDRNEEESDIEDQSDTEDESDMEEEDESDSEVFNEQENKSEDLENRERDLGFNKNSVKEYLSESDDEYARNEKLSCSNITSIDTESLSESSDCKVPPQSDKNISGLMANRIDNYYNLRNRNKNQSMNKSESHKYDLRSMADSPHLNSLRTESH